MSIQNVAYRAYAEATGGRDGRAISSDGVLDVALTTRENWVAQVVKVPTQSSCSLRATQPVSWVQ